MFTITRVYSDAEGDSRFEDISIPLTEEGALGKLSEGVPVKELLFREVAPEYDYDFHTAPQRQYIIRWAISALLREAMYCWWKT
jgi:hypothetical protein